jgi:hypothetical protein
MAQNGVTWLFATMPSAWPILVTMSASARLLRREGEGIRILDEAEALLDPVSDIDASCSLASLTRTWRRP